MNKTYNELTEHEKIKIVDIYYNDSNLLKTFKEMSALLGVSQRSFSRVLKENKINTKRNNRYIIKNENYFENINNELKAYFLGFIYADGAVGENNDIIINLKNSKENMNILNRFISEIGYDGKTKITNKYNPYTLNESIRLNFSCEKMWMDLNKLGVVPNKSLKLDKLPQINSSLYCHFIRGYFDGDGSICSYYDNSDKRIRYILGILGTENFLNDIQNKLKELCDIKIIKLHNTKSEFTKEIRHRGKKNILKIREFLYNSATFYINYKKDKMFDI